MDFSNIPEGSDEEPKKNSSSSAENLVFHYNREERLKNAPQNVKDYYSGKFKPYKQGIFKSLVSTKANRMIFFALLICVGAVLFNTFFGGRDNKTDANGIPLELKAFSVEEKIYVSLKAGKVSKKNRQKISGGVPIFATFSALDSQKNALLSSQENDLYDGKELFLRTTFTDFDIIQVSAEIALNFDGTEQIFNLSTNVEKR